MANDPERHVRARLARQRTAPRRVQPLARDDGSTSQPQPARTEPAPTPDPAPPPAPRIGPWLRAWGGRITLARLGAATAIATLLFTGIATYFQAEVSSRQLDDARQQSALVRRQQAMHVTFWNDWTSIWLDLTPDSVHVMNRSPDPITYADLVFTLTPLYPPKGGTGKRLDRMIISSIPPCTELTFDATGLIPLPPGFTNPDPVLSHIYSVQSTALYFTDSNGLQWRRDATHLTNSEPDPSLTTALIGGPAPTSSHVEQCDSGAT